VLPAPGVSAGRASSRGAAGAAAGVQVSAMPGLLPLTRVAVLMPLTEFAIRPPIRSRPQNPDTCACGWRILA
jgi:hypothetical protein